MMVDVEDRGKKKRNSSDVDSSSILSDSEAEFVVPRVPKSKKKKKVVIGDFLKKSLNNDLGIMSDDSMGKRIVIGKKVLKKEKKLQVQMENAKGKLLFEDEGVVGGEMIVGGDGCGNVVGGAGANVQSGGIVGASLRASGAAESSAHRHVEADVVVLENGVKNVGSSSSEVRSSSSMVFSDEHKKINGISDMVMSVAKSLGNDERAVVLMEAVRKYELFLLNLVHEHIVEKAIMNPKKNSVSLTYADVAANPGIRMDIAAGRMAPLPIPGALVSKPKILAGSVRPVRSRSIKKTFAVVVKSNDPEVDVLENVRSKVLKEIGAKIDRATSSKKNEAVIFVPSEDDLKLCLNAPVFKQLNLVVQDRQQFVTLFKLPYVPKELKTEEVMDELEKQLGVENFSGHVKINRKGLNGDEDILYVNASELVAEELRKVERLYVKWFSFPVFEINKSVQIKSCYRCLGSHLVWQCKQTENTCKNCGKIGHMSDKCSNATSCRDCSLKGVASDHLMHTAACPMYLKKLAILKHNG